MCVENMDWSNDIRFNSKKSVVIIFRNSFAKDFSFPSFVMNGESINEVPFVKYIGHVINDDMKDDLDIMRQCKQLYIHKALLRFHTCSDNMKVTIFRSYCSSLYTWCGGSSRLTPLLYVEYNNAFCMLFMLIIII